MLAIDNIPSSTPSTGCKAIVMVADVVRAEKVTADALERRSLFHSGVVTGCLKPGLFVLAVRNKRSCSPDFNFSPMGWSGLRLVLILKEINEIEVVTESGQSG